MLCGHVYSHAHLFIWNAWPSSTRTSRRSTPRRHSPPPGKSLPDDHLARHETRGTNRGSERKNVSHPASGCLRGNKETQEGRDPQGTDLQGTAPPRGAPHTTTERPTQGARPTQETHRHVWWTCLSLQHKKRHGLTQPETDKSIYIVCHNCTIYKIGFCLFMNSLFFF